MFSAISAERLRSHNSSEIPALPHSFAFGGVVLLLQERKTYPSLLTYLPRVPPIGTASACAVVEKIRAESPVAFFFLFSSFFFLQS